RGGHPQDPGRRRSRRRRHDRSGGGLGPLESVLFREGKVTPRAQADLTTAELGSLFESWGFNPAHAVRIMRSFYRSKELPGSLPKGLAERIRRELAPGSARLVKRQVAEDGTIKLLLGLA